MGGDLMSLLERDIRLPEPCIHDFGRDLAIALQVQIESDAASSRSSLPQDRQRLCSGEWHMPLLQLRRSRPSPENAAPGLIAFRKEMHS